MSSRRIGVPVFLDSDVVFDDLTHARAEEIIAKYPESRSALLPLLHLVQSVEGFVSQPGIEFCGQKLGLTDAEVSAVATFYTMYKRNPCGEHLISVCTNALCAGLGGDAIYATLTSRLGVGNEETAGEPGAPGSITIEHAECLAACDHAPVLQVNYEYYDNQTPDSALDLVTALQAGRTPAADPRRAAHRFPQRRTGDRRHLHRSAQSGGHPDRIGADVARLGAGRAHRPAGAHHAELGRVPAAARKEVRSRP